MLRATLKSLLARKLRLTLSMIAVVLSVMFIAGSFVLTDTLGRSFDALFANIYTYTDVQVQPVSNTGSTDLTGTTLPASLVDQVKHTPGVAKATGQVFTNGANVVGHSGKLVTNQSGQRFGGNWTGEDDLVQLAEGRGPTAADEITINKGLETAGDFKLGDSVDIITPYAGRQTFKLVGSFLFAGGRESMAGEQTVFFTEPVAQQDLLGKSGVYSDIDVKAQSGTSKNQLRDAIKSAIGSGYQVKTGDELAKESAQPFKDIFKYINYVLVGFGLVAVLVGVFLILNTFSIIVAQRTRELALLRSMGASRGQVLRSVLLEAILIGVIGSALGFGVGIGLGALGAYGLGASAGGSLKVASLGVPPIAAILSFAIGISVTVIAALVPALRASRVPPIAALRESAATDRPLTKITIAGAIVFIGGVVPLALGLSGAGGATLTLILVGVLALLIGVALLTPLISRPVVSLLGRLFSWSVAGKLGRRNSSRNPRRTAITAAAVMIGIALVTAISTVFTSLSTSIGKVVDEELQADLVVSGQQTSQVPPTIQPDELKRIRDLSDVQTVAAATFDGGKVNGKTQYLIAYDDWSAARTVLKLTQDQGDIDSLGPDQLVVDRKTADDNKLTVGQKLQVTLPKSGEHTFTLVGITAPTTVGNGYTISNEDAQAGFRFPKPIQAFVKVRDGTDVNHVKSEVSDILANNPEVDVQTRKEYVGTSTSFFDVILAAVQVLLLVALAISILGVINTLVLSVIERTRELGMLRAIGLRRSQTMRMVTTESVVIVLFGTILGLVVGGGLGAAIVHALKDAVGFGDVTLPWTLMSVYLVAALVVGVFAAIIPAVRAARLNVLGAIAYE
jgi:putative ABC transport system permease protein